MEDNSNEEEGAGYDLVRVARDVLRLSHSD